jgi:GNAT superfamily N-acetyltransferase
MIIELEDSSEALQVAKQVSEEFVLPTFSEKGKKAFSMKLARDVEAAFSDPNVNVYGIRTNGTLLGYIAVSKKFHIAQLYIVSTEQRRGLGRMLISFIEQQVKSSGGSRLTVKASLNAVPFYEKCGFEITSDPQEISGIRFQPMQKLV